MEEKIVILPGCSDVNRGDQALVWETIAIAKDSGFSGEYFMLGDEDELKQSIAEGYQTIEAILPIPTRYLKNKNNIHYNFRNVIRMMFLSIPDIMVSLSLLNPIAKKFFRKKLTKKQKRTLEIIEESKAIFVKGGGFLHAYGGLSESYKIFYFLYHIELALSIGKPVYIMPNSFGPFKGFLVKQMISFVLKKCKFIASRETISQKALEKECAITSYCTNDLAFYLAKSESFDVLHFLNNIKLNLKKGKSVAITVRPYRFPGEVNPDKLYRNYVDSICFLISSLLDENYQVVMIEHVYSDSYHEQDRICINDILDKLPDNKKVPVFSHLELNCREMKAIYGAFDYLVGTRFHSVIFSLTEKVPSIAITYGGNKGDGIMENFGLSDYAIKINNVNGDTLLNKFHKMVANKSDIERKLLIYNENLKKERERLISMIKGK